MRSIPLLTEAERLARYTIRVHFEDGAIGEVDLSYMLDHGGVFEALRDPDYSPGARGPRGRDHRLAQRRQHRTRDLYAHAQGRTAATV